MKRYIKSSKLVQYRIYEGIWDDEYNEYNYEECIDTADTEDDAISKAVDYSDSNNVPVQVVQVVDEDTETIWDNEEKFV